MGNSDRMTSLLSGDFLKLCRDRKLLAGFSGGTDSTALLLMLKEADLDVTAIHFQHGLRGRESEEDAIWSGEFARKHNIPFLCIDLTVAAAGSVEANAREARLEAWKQLTARDGEFPGAAVVLAHHSDDAVETMLERIARGGNVSSLAALRPVRMIRGVEFFRPLLSASKKELEEYLAGKDISDCRFDSTNASCDYFRNHIRNRVLPVWGEGFNFLRGGLIASLQALCRDSELLEKMAAEVWDSRPYRAEGRNKISAQWFNSLAGAIRFRVLGKFFRINNVPETNIASVLARLECSSCGSVPIDDTYQLQMIRGFWKICRNEHDNYQWQWRDIPEITFNGDIYRVRLAEAPDFAAKDLSACDIPCCDRVWFPVNILPEILELSISRQGRTIRRDNCSKSEAVKNFKKPDCVIGIPGDEEVLWLAGVRRSCIYPVTAGEQCAVFERIPRK